MNRAPGRVLPVAVGLAAAAVLAGCGSESAGAGSDASASVSSTTSVPSSPSTAQDASGGEEASVPQGYIGLGDYEADPAAYAETDVVLFFHATWCPTCKAADDSLTSNPVPTGLTIVKVDYDENTDLKERYGVTVQHTFVQVDPDGTELAKWTGSTTAEQIAGHTV
jgi:thioredoxin 1